MKTTAIIDPRSGQARAISRLGLGCSRFGSLGNPATSRELQALIGLALDLGITVFDTADIYGQGDSEREIGRALRGARRDRGFVITKFGKRFSPAMTALRPLKPLAKPLLALRRGGSAITARREGAMREDFSPDRLAAALDASLRRLRFDHVDAVLLHGPPTEVYGQAGIHALFERILAGGKARHVGASCEVWADVAAAMAIPSLSMLQLPFDLLAPLEASPLAGDLARRSIALVVREAIRLQPDRPPPQAVAEVAQRQYVATVLAGSSRPAHLAQLAAACD